MAQSSDHSAAIAGGAVSGVASDVLRDRVQALNWYHTIELGPGLITEGMFDHRRFLDRYSLPERLDGLRVLDIGTWDGFWAFEMERRGAAEVVAIDLDSEADMDRPPGRGPAEPLEQRRGEAFSLARDVLGSSVDRRVVSVYEATPAELGRFDLIFCGSVLIHLRDPMLALQRIFDLCEGTFVSAEVYSRMAGLSPIPVAFFRADRPKSVVFWEPSARTWRRMLLMSGFSSVERRSRFRLQARDGWSVPHVVHVAQR